MSEFQEDMIFKNVNGEDTKLFLDILGIKSNKARIMVQELQELDPTTFVPDIILELDEEIRIIELQSVKVHKVHHKRFHVYLAMADLKFDKFGKKITLSVFSKAEKSKKVRFNVVLCDVLGDRMSLIHEYARNKEDRLIRNLLRAGNSPQKIAKDAKIPLSRVKRVERTLKSK